MVLQGIRDGGSRVVLVDMGMVGRSPPKGSQSLRGACSSFSGASTCMASDTGEAACNMEHISTSHATFHRCAQTTQHVNHASHSF